MEIVKNPFPGLTQGLTGQILCLLASADPINLLYPGNESYVYFQIGTWEYSSNHQAKMTKEIEKSAEGPKASSHQTMFQ